MFKIFKKFKKIIQPKIFAADTNPAYNSFCHTDEEIRKWLDKKHYCLSIRNRNEYYKVLNYLDEHTDMKWGSNFDLFDIADEILKQNYTTINYFTIIGGRLYYG